MAKKPRNYREEYDNYHGTDKQKKRRASRNTAHRIASAAGKVGPGEDVAHKDNNPNNNSLSNLEGQSKSKNRSFARTKTAGMKKKTKKKKTKSYNQGGPVTL